MIRVLLADDQALVRAGMRTLLEVEPDLLIVGEASDGREAVARTAALQPDVVLMDIRMPVLDGISATAQVVAARSPSRICVLTTYGTTTTCSMPCALAHPGSCSRPTPPPG